MLTNIPVLLFCLLVVSLGCEFYKLLIMNFICMFHAQKILRVKTQRLNVNSSKTNAILIMGGGMSPKVCRNLRQPSKYKSVFNVVSYFTWNLSIWIFKNCFCKISLGVKQMYSALCSKGIYWAPFLIWKSKNQNKARVKITSSLHSVDISFI